MSDLPTTVLPDIIDNYRVLRPIARGGMAEVYEVEDRSNGEHLALKLLTVLGGALPRFNREYEAMIRLNHPNIVRVYHYGFHGEHPWLTMELVAGTPIQAYAKRCGRKDTPRRTEEVIRTSHDLALALDHIHRRGLVHRDLKSANVLVLPDGRVKLIDFGTAKVFQAVEDITREGEFIGTFAYASPEQLTQQPVDHRSDLYSLGVLMYRLATAKRPFDAKDLHELARQHVKDIPKPPTQIARNLPKGLEDVILALLEKRPENRPQSGAEVAATLEAVAGHPLFLSGTLDVDLSTESLVGREDQMSRLWNMLDAAEAGGLPPASATLITGLQGSGRQRAIQALEKDVRKRGWRVITWFFHRDGDPLDTMAAALDDLATSFESEETIGEHTARRARAQVRRLETLPASERIQALAETADDLLELRSRADPHPLLILLRGLHNAGAVGIEAIVRLRERIARSRARVIVVGDVLETSDDAQSLTRMRLEDANRVHLPPMGVREVALLVGSLLHRRPPPGPVARRIYEASGGLPVYVEEVVRRMVENGLLRVQGRDANRIEWAQQDDMDVPVPAAARQRVLDRLAELPADRRRVLEALSLLDGEGSATVLAGALQCRGPELIPAMRDLAIKGWITLGERNEVPYAHWRQALAEQVVLEQLNPCRRRVFELKLTDQVANHPAFAAQIRLLLGVGRFEDAMARALDWSVHHIAKNRPDTALEVLDEVIPCVDLAPIETSDKARLYLMHVTALLMSRPTDVNTSRSLAKATRLGRTEGDHFEAELHLLRARIQRVIGHYPNFRKHLMEAWYLVENASATALAATVADLLGWSNRAAGAVDAAATWHGRARRIAVQVGVPAVRAHADVGVAGWQYARGLLEEAERTATGSLKVFREYKDARGLSEVIPVWASTLREQGRFSEVFTVLNQQAPLMRESESPSLYVRLLLATAWAEVDVCRLGRAQECVDELAATLRRGEHLDLRLEADLVWGRILLASGQLQEALHRLHFVRDRAQNAGLQIIAEWAGAFMAEVLMGMGDANGAHERFQESIESLVRAGHVPVATSACRAQARAMGHLIDPDQIFTPVKGYIDRQPCVAARLERNLARARYAAAHRTDPRPFVHKANAAITEINSVLSPTDQAAMYLHPWSREVRLAGVA